MEQKIASTTRLDYYHTTDMRVLDGIADTMALTIRNPKIRPKVVVTIPAHNEEGNIADCLLSLADQRTVFDNFVDPQEFEVLVLCHNCTDNTRRICQRIQDGHKNFNLRILDTARPEVNNVGAVRRILMRIARSRVTYPKGYIATTDADTIVGRYWMANLLGYLGSGYGCIGGHIDIQTLGMSDNSIRILALKRQYEILRTHLEDRFIPNPWDPAPRHSHNSGPNLAVRADVYDGVGGMPPIGFCEDIAFYDLVVWGGHKVRHCPLTKVTTSGRIDPRTPWGFGAELRVWSENDTCDLEVEGLLALLERFAIYRLVEQYCDRPEKSDLCSIAQRSGLEKGMLRNYFKNFVGRKAIVHKLEKDLDGLESWRARYPKVGVRQACAELEQYLSASPSHGFKP